MEWHVDTDNASSCWGRVVNSLTTAAYKTWGRLPKLYKSCLQKLGPAHSIILFVLCPISCNVVQLLYIPVGRISNDKAALLLFLLLLLAQASTCLHLVIYLYFCYGTVGVIVMMTEHFSSPHRISCCSSLIVGLAFTFSILSVLFFFQCSFSSPVLFPCYNPGSRGACGIPTAARGATGRRAADHAEPLLRAQVPRE